MKMNGTGIRDESEESACCKLVAVSETGCSGHSLSFLREILYYP